MTFRRPQDKTFGLKNKKGAKTQKFIQQVQKNTLGQHAADKKKEPSKKEEKLKKIEELNTLFKPVQPVQKVEAGVNPKSVLCAYYKQGTCSKGDKCKFSHDLSLARKAATRNYYEEEKKEEDRIEDWDDAKLQEVVEKKHGENDRKMPKTDIICKFFLESLENSTYGWFWECPNGGEKCHYRHVLPAGYVLKKDAKKNKKEEISIEDLVERERAALGYDLPKITLSSFLAWKKKKIDEKRAKDATENEKKKADLKAGKSVALSGREMFTLNPDLVADDVMDEGETAFDSTTRQDLDDESEAAIRALDADKLAAGATDADGSGTIVASSDRKKMYDFAINEDLFSEEQLDEELEQALDSLTIEQPANES